MALHPSQAQQVRSHLGQFFKGLLRPFTLLALAYLGIFLVILYLAYTGNLPQYLGTIPYYDKVGHVVLYSIATYLGHRVIQRRHLRVGRWSLPLFPLGFALWTGVEEVIQQFSPNRTLDLGDLICSGLGIALGYWLSQHSSGRKPR